MNQRTDVITVFLQHDNKILLGKRSEDVRTYPNYWAGISGYLETDDPLDQAYVEIEEETGLSQEDVSLEKTGETIDVDDGEHQWRVHPFRFKVGKDSKNTVRVDREHIEFNWVSPDTIPERKTVPNLKEAWTNVADG
ncbi:MAG: NUDIX domain-containing protein [bacterium]